MVALEADQILAALERNEVRYVLIGGLAAILHGSPQLTSFSIVRCAGVTGGTPHRHSSRAG